jgi:hypothetical protein
MSTDPTPDRAVQFEYRPHLLVGFRHPGRDRPHTTKSRRSRARAINVSTCTVLARLGSPDFLNGLTHAIRIVEAVHEEFPELTYDVTIKVEHLLVHAKLLPVLKQTGCLFVTTAVESVDDGILAILEKGHTREDFFQVVRLFDEVGGYRCLQPSWRLRRGPPWTVTWTF